MENRETETKTLCTFSEFRKTEQLFIPLASWNTLTMYIFWMRNYFESWETLQGIYIGVKIFHFQSSLRRSNFKSASYHDILPSKPNPVMEKTQSEIRRHATKDWSDPFQRFCPSTLGKWIPFFSYGLILSRCLTPGGAGNQQRCPIFFTSPILQRLGEYDSLRL